MSYEQNERRLFNADLQRVEKQSLRDRQEARKEFAAALKNPELVAERIGWLLAGNYGKGSYDAAREVVGNKRMNREAWLTTTIAALEWSCPGKFAVEAWKKLNAAEKASLDRAIAREMKSAEEE